MRHVWPLLKTPGQHIDPGFANFGVRVSPKLKSVWVIRRSSGTGAARKEVTETLGLVQFPDSIPDGSNILDLVQAQAAAREWLAEQKDPVYAAKKRAERLKAGLKPLTLGDAFAEYKVERKTKRATSLSEQTIVSYDKTFKKHLAASANLPLLTTGVKEWKEIFKAINLVSPSKALEAMCIVSGVYTYFESVDHPGMVANPIRKVRLQRIVVAPKKREGHAEPVDLPKLVANIWVLRNKQSRDVLLCYLLGGFRKMSALRFRRSILTIKGGVIDVNVPPGERGWKSWTGTLPLNSQVAGILNERIAEMDRNGDTGDWLFPARHGTSKHSMGADSSLKIACEGLGLKKGLETHDLRRTFGTVCEMLYPGDVALLAALLTHKWAMPDDVKTKVTLGYQPRPMETLRHASETIANAILEIAGVLDMTDATKAALERKGIDPHRLVLIDYEDDSTPGVVEIEI